MAEVIIFDYGKQAQLQGMESNDIWVIKVDDNGNIIFHQPARKPTLATVNLALDFAQAIITVCRYALDN